MVRICWMSVKHDAMHGGVPKHHHWTCRILLMKLANLSFGGKKSGKPIIWGQPYFGKCHLIGGSVKNPPVYDHCWHHSPWNSHGCPSVSEGLLRYNATHAPHSGCHSWEKKVEVPILNDWYITGLEPTEITWFRTHWKWLGITSDQESTAAFMGEQHRRLSDRLRIQRIPHEASKCDALIFSSRNRA